jgi:hypothetical protein
VRPGCRAGSGPAKRIESRVESAPKLDDYAADGNRWRSAVSSSAIGDLVPVSDSTTAYLSYDQDSLYVAFVCKSANPRSIRARMSRRESIFDDDFVAVHLDPFQERQRAYMFFSNPIGIQADGVTSEGSGDDMSYDAVWSSSGRRTPDGYVVLIGIPFKSLRFLDRSVGVGHRCSGIPTRKRRSGWHTNRISGLPRSSASSPRVAPGTQRPVHPAAGPLRAAWTRTWHQLDRRRLPRRARRQLVLMPISSMTINPTSARSVRRAAGHDQISGLRCSSRRSGRSSENADYLTPITLFFRAASAIRSWARA